MTTTTIKVRSRVEPTANAAEPRFGRSIVQMQQLRRDADGDADALQAALLASNRPRHAFFARPQPNPLARGLRSALRRFWAWC